MTILSLLFWIVVPEMSYFIGARSLFDAFLFALGVEKRWLSFIALLWIPTFITSFVACYIRVLKKNKYIPICVNLGIELAVSLLFIVYKVYTKNFTDLDMMLIGYLVRVLFYIWMISFIQSQKKRDS